MQTQKANWVQYTTLVLAAIVLLGGFFYYKPAEPITVNYPTAAEIASEVAPLLTVPDNTEVLNAVGEVQTILNEDDLWEQEAEELATAEWSNRDYKPIFEFIDDRWHDIDDREDIIYVHVKDTTFSDMDADDQDAFVVQELKVKYEDEDGQDRVRYLTVETEIEEGEVEDQEISNS